VGQGGGLEEGEALYCDPVSICLPKLFPMVANVLYTYNGPDLPSPAPPLSLLASHLFLKLFVISSSHGSVRVERVFFPFSY
jgi:hypothetical protein